MTPLHRILLVSLFAMAFAFVESSIVVYLRALYYPEGITFPLKMISQEHLAVELAREVATIIMLVAVGMIAGTYRWKKFGYFLVAFGVWDIFYYLWLKVILDWPRTLTDWDVLFLIPVPWIGPVIAPLLLSLLMTSCGTVMIVRLERAQPFRARLVSWFLGLTATAAALYSFISGSPGILRGETPAPYPYGFLILSIALYLAGFLIACRERGQAQLGATH